MAPRTFTDRDALITGIIAIVEIILFIIYVCVSAKRMRAKMIAMGRLIPAIPVVIVGGHGVITGVPVATQQPSGYAQDYPPPYHTVADPARKF